jgi:ribonuclease J
VAKTPEGSSDEEKGDAGVMKEEIRQDLKRYIHRNAERRPLIMPVILEIQGRGLGPRRRDLCA